ncbi:MAG TPA: Spy/CpxP family protein refolding chaperone [Acetobacteraceae bacterium]|jgi:periplasmic protein CpxP/Spy|nr:Spy/CpxP family protein refolding chaperone [Acetobacteraceae bacterium]
MNGKSCLVALALIAPLALPASALAQTQAPPTQAPSTSAPAAPGPQNGPESVRQHIADLHAMLQVTPAEEPQWNRFAQAMTANADSMHQAFEQRGAQLGTMNAAQDMESYAQLAALHAKNMQTIADAFQALYAVMPPAQQQNADTVFRSGGAPMGHHTAAATH